MYEELKFLINLFQNRFSILSMHKYSAQVIDKCFEQIKDEFINSFIDEIIKNNRVIDLIKNNIGNSIIQKTLKVVNDQYRLKLIQYVETNIERIGDRKLIQNWRMTTNNIINIEIMTNDYSNLMPYNHPYIMNTNYYNQMFNNSLTYNNNYFFNNMYSNVNSNRKNNSMPDYNFKK
jgi:hypothetical protein